MDSEQPTLENLKVALREQFKWDEKDPPKKIVDPLLNEVAGLPAEALADICTEMLTEVYDSEAVDVDLSFLSLEEITSLTVFPTFKIYNVKSGKSELKRLAMAKKMELMMRVVASSTSPSPRRVPVDEEPKQSTINVNDLTAIIRAASEAATSATLQALRESQVDKVKKDVPQPAEAQQKMT
jgi:hypothetical protein